MIKTIKAKDLARVLQKKGFQLDQGARHQQYYFYYQGEPTLIRVSVSRGSNSEYSKKLLNLVIKEMKLDKTQFEEFVQCPMTEDMYAEQLIKEGLIT